jgi:3-oxoacyl-[acyl-carrier protein] reductase
LSAFGKVDIVINNAGVLITKKVIDMNDEEFDSIFASNVRGPFVVMREAAKLLSDGGRIINFSSSTTRCVCLCVCVSVFV